jgi:integrase
VDGEGAAFLPRRKGLAPLAASPSMRPAISTGLPRAPAVGMAVRSSNWRASRAEAGRGSLSLANTLWQDPAKWHPHLLRHACGTHMHDHNAPLQTVATFLGHAKLSTAQISPASQSGRMMQTYRAAHPHAR